MTTKIFGLCISLLLFLPTVAQAAQLRINLLNDFTIFDKTFSISVVAQDDVQSFNAAEVTLLFDPNKLELIESSSQFSIFDLWVKEPELKSAGTIHLIGGTTKDGFIGTGEIARFKFKSLQGGYTPIQFGQASVISHNTPNKNILKKSFQEMN